MNVAPRRSVTDDQLPPGAAAARPRPTAMLVTLAACAMLVFAGLVALGTWQVRRLHWKLDLIDRVEHRVHAPAVAAPGPERWPRITAASDEYRHVRVTGTFLYSLTTRVQAVTELGSGFWLLTPLRTTDGNVVLINRGYVPAQEAGAGRKGGDSQAEQAQDGHRSHGVAVPDVSTVTGLLRMSEPGGAFLRHNDPAANRWYSRDVQAIARARGLPVVAPYFIDADAASTPAQADRYAPGHPVGGLTVIAFRNNHLVYALTWYALALMVAGGCAWVARDERRLRRLAGAGRTNGADGTERGNDDGSDDGRQQ